MKRRALERLSPREGRTWAQNLAISAASCCTPGSRMLKLAGLAVCAVVAPHSHASTFQQYSLQKLVEKSPLIVRAVATTVEPTGNFDSNGNPCTAVVLNTLEVLKGDSDTSRIEFCNTGGIQLDGRLSIPVQLPTFTPGSTYLLFLNPRGWILTPVVNWTAGIFREIPDGSRKIYADGEGHAVVGLGSEGFKLGAEIDEPELFRLLKAHQVPIDVLRIDPQTRLAETPQEANARRSAAKRNCAPVKTILEKVRAAIPQDAVQSNGTSAFDVFSAPIVRGKE